jgi:hypothetical protein
MTHNLAPLLDEATSPRTIGVELKVLREDKKNFYNFIYIITRGGAICLNPKMMHNLVENGYSL